MSHSFSGVGNCKAGVGSDIIVGRGYGPLIAVAKTLEDVEFLLALGRYRIFPFESELNDLEGIND